MIQLSWNTVLQDTKLRYFTTCVWSLYTWIIICNLYQFVSSSTSLWILKAFRSCLATDRRETTPEQIIKFIIKLSHRTYICGFSASFCVIYAVAKHRIEYQFWSASNAEDYEIKEQYMYTCMFVLYLHVCTVCTYRMHVLYIRHHW